MSRYKQATGLYNTLTNTIEMETVLNINSLLFASTEFSRNNLTANFLKFLVLLNATLEAQGINNLVESL